ncbi:hypothetical protein RvY_04688 [Ramazzottius varieornatus]|uniref:alkaline phosphatase n=1 Tax=Ramazzottius varieornatus TaxID=947166 RepID=A0A1D1UVY6_RAMVA|nr:hypothetical protein RvY_04688 [Ramazzottius varieornatus]
MIAEDELQRASNVRKIEKRPKNVIFFSGDGMGTNTTLTASRLYKGQHTKTLVNKAALVFEKFPHVWPGQGEQTAM